jgi:hypothetical protein
MLVFTPCCRAEEDQHENFADVADCNSPDGLRSFEYDGKVSAGTQ